MVSTQESVTNFLEEKKVPMSLKSISKKLRLKKRPVLAVCKQNPDVTMVHPSHCGSGKTKASIFVWSKDNKWVTSKEFI